MSKNKTRIKMSDMANIPEDLSEIDMLPDQMNRSEKFLKILEQVRKNDPRFINLDLSYQLIGHDGAKALADTLKTNDTLQNINLTFNKLRDASVKLIFEAIQENKTLTSLNLNHNFFGDDRYNVDYEAILTKNKTLKILSFEGCRFSPEKASALNAIISRNQSLSEVPSTPLETNPDGSVKKDSQTAIQESKSPVAIVTANFVAQVSEDVAKNLIPKDGVGFARKASTFISSGSNKGDSR